MTPTRRPKYKTIDPQLLQAGEAIDKFVPRILRRIDGYSIGLAEFTGGAKASAFAHRYLRQRYRNAIAAHLAVPLDDAFVPDPQTESFRLRAIEIAKRDQPSNLSTKAENAYAVRKNTTIQKSLRCLREFAGGKHLEAIAKDYDLTETRVCQMLRAAMSLVMPDLVLTKAWKRQIRELPFPIIDACNKHIDHP